MTLEHMIYFLRHPLGKERHVHSLVEPGSEVPFDVFQPPYLVDPCITTRGMCLFRPILGRNDVTAKGYCPAGSHMF
eukprot:12850321-Ditylum_brightwellii.AAC.2